MLDYQNNGADGTISFAGRSNVSAAQYYFNVTNNSTGATSSVAGFCTDYTQTLADPEPYAILTNHGRWVPSTPRDSEAGFSWMVFQSFRGQTFTDPNVVAAHNALQAVCAGFFNGVSAGTAAMVTAWNQIETAVLWEMYNNPTNPTDFTNRLLADWTTSSISGSVSGTVVDATFPGGSALTGLAFLREIADDFYAQIYSRGASGYTATYYMPSDSNGNVISTSQPILVGGAAAAVPEPASITLAGLGLLSFLFPSARKRRS